MHADTPAYGIWSLVVLLLIFPWQAFLNNQDMSGIEWKVPGVLYNWDELAANGRFENGLANWKFYVRYLIAPLVTMILVFVVLLKSAHGLRMALGEETESSKKRKDELEDDLGGDRNVIR